MEGGDRGDRAVGVRAPQLDVLPCANAAGEIGDGAPQKARAEIEPDHECCVGHGLEEDRAVARPVGPFGRLAHQARLLE